MLTITFTAVNGGEMVFEELLELTYSQRADTPADSLQVRMFVDRPLPEFTAVRAAHGKTCFFEGIVDEQCVEAAGGGAVLEISARSAAAVLLDNEAIPASYNYPSLEDIYKLHLKPYGIRGVIGAGRCHAVYTVRPGLSEWEVASRFCRSVLGVIPRITPAFYLDASGQPSGETVCFSNTAYGAVRYLRAGLRTMRYGVIGEIRYKADSDSAYVYSVKNPTAAARGITARRAVNVAGGADWEKNTRLRDIFLASEEGAAEITLDSPDFIVQAAGSRARFFDPLLGDFVNWVLYERTYTLRNGVLTSGAVLRPAQDLERWSADVAHKTAIL